MERDNTGSTKLLEQVHNVLRRKHYSIHTERSYITWIKKYIGFHHMRHPRSMGKEEIEAFLTHLAVKRKVFSSTQNQAFNAIMFLYRDVLEIELNGTLNAVRAKRPARVPVVMSHEEAMKVIHFLKGTYHLMPTLFYGSGLRLMECVRLRVKDIDFEMNSIRVLDGKGKKDRVVMLPEAAKPSLIEHLKQVRVIHEHDLQQGNGRVYLPYALEIKGSSH